MFRREVSYFRLILVTSKQSKI